MSTRSRRLRAGCRIIVMIVAAIVSDVLNASEYTNESRPTVDEPTQVGPPPGTLEFEVTTVSDNWAFACTSMSLLTTQQCLTCLNGALQYSPASDPCGEDPFYFKLACPGTLGVAAPIGGIANNVYVPAGMGAQLYAGVGSTQPIGEEMFGPLIVMDYTLQDMLCTAPDAPAITVDDEFDNYSLRVRTEGICPAPCTGAVGEECRPLSPAPDDRTFVVDLGDSDCRFRSGIPPFVQIPVTRYVGPTYPDMTPQEGTLQHAPQLVQNELLGAYALLTIAAFDVDESFDNPCAQPERDVVWFNGVAVSSYYTNENSPYLSGSHCGWQVSQYKIPIEKLKFPSARGENGSPPTPAFNDVSVTVDTANAGAFQEVWCVKIGWVALEYLFTV